MDKKTMMDKAVVEEADKVLQTVLVIRFGGAITTEDIKTVVESFDRVYQFTKMEKREVLGRLVTRFIPLEF